MKKLLSVITLLFTICLVPTALGTQNITDCNQASLGGDVYLVQNDINMDLDQWCWFVDNDTVIDCQGYTFNHNGSYWFGQTPNHINNVTFRNCIVNYSSDGDVPLSQGFYLTDGSGDNLLFENITFYQEIGGLEDFNYGLYVPTGVSGNRSSNITIRDITFDNVNASRIIEIWYADNVLIDNVNVNSSITDSTIPNTKIVCAQSNNVEIINCNLSDNYKSIGIQGGYNTTIRDSVFYNHTDDAIYFQVSSVSLVDNCEFYGERAFIDYQSNNTLFSNSIIHESTGYGTTSWESNYTTYSNVTINNTTYSGILIGGTTKPSENILIDNCAFANIPSDSGSLRILGATNLTVRNSDISNSGYGILMSTFGGSYYNNVEDVWIYNNSVYDNDVANAYFSDEINYSNVNFNSSTLGNSWDDYTGCDDNGDGIGETAYTVNETLSLFDFLPLTDTVCAGPTPPVDQIPGGFGGIAAVIIAASWILFAVGSFTSGKLNTELIIALIITLVITLSFVGYLILG